MVDKVTILILTDRRHPYQKEKAKLMFQTLINMNDVERFVETKEFVHIETSTHFIRVVNLDQSPRGYRANFIFDLSGLPDAQDTAYYKSTYNWSCGGKGEFKVKLVEPVDNQLKENSWYDKTN